MNSRMRIALLAAAMASLPAAAEGPKKVSADMAALDVVATVDKDEVSAAKHALTKKVSADVADYARMMERDHSANLTETKKLLGKDAAAVKSAPAEQAAKDDAAMMAKLKPLQGAAFERAYVDAMVDGHTKVLGKLDNELIPGAQDAKVKAHLQKTREAVSMHLDHAKQLQAKL